MIGTIEIKKQQLTSGAYCIGSGQISILIIGSCRAVPYLNYLNDYNKIENKYTIYFIDPFNWNWDLQDNRTDYFNELLKQEKNEHLLSILKKTDIFIHEYYANARMFNCNKADFNNIYTYGLSPSMDITLPNFNDIFILTCDIISFDMDLRKKAIQDYNVIGKLSKQTLEGIELLRDNNINKFYDICKMGSYPEFAEIFKNNYKKKRYFWTFNHIANNFTLDVFKLICNDLVISPENVSQVDLYANNYTYLCEYDYGYEWNEEIKLLKTIL